MNREQILTGILAVLIVLSAFQTYQLKNLNSKINGGIDAAAGAAGETYEQMMARMHGSSPAAASTAAQASSSGASSAGAGMVGGC